MPTVIGADEPELPDEDPPHAARSATGSMAARPAPSQRDAVTPRFSSTLTTLLREPGRVGQVGRSVTSDYLRLNLRAPTCSGLPPRSRPCQSAAVPRTPETRNPPERRSRTSRPRRKRHGSTGPPPPASRPLPYAGGPSRP